MASNADARLREELEEAIAKVRHQIEVQSTADHYLGSERISQEALRELQNELAELEEALGRVT